jgi:hypothetical protein
MVEMADFERPIAVPRRRHIQFPEERCGLRGGSGSLAFGDLLMARSTISGRGETLITGCRNSTILAGSHERRVHGELPFLFECLVVSVEELIDQGQRRFGQLPQAVPAVAQPRQKPDEAASVDPLSHPPAR